MATRSRSHLAIAAAVAGFLATFALPCVAEAQSLISTMQLDRWAIGTPAGCGVPSRSYWLTSDGNTITWRNGMGSIDVEAIVDSGPGGFSTITVTSRHANGAGEATGTRWSYALMDVGLVRVIPSNKGPFFLARCRR